MRKETDLERLDEALEWLDHQPHAEALTAARELRKYRNLVANGERVEWCETHGYPPWHGYDLSHDVAVCEYAMRGSHRPCSFVSRLLVDPPTEEDR